MPEAAASARRAYASTLALLAIGGVVVVIAYGLEWGIATVGVLPGSAEATRELSVTGGELYPGAAMAGWVCLACVGGILATRSWGRRLVAVIGLLAGLAAAGMAVSFAVDAEGAISRSVADLVSADARAAWILAVVGGAAVTTASVATIARGRAWPAMGARYERADTGRRRSDWDAQDAGEDPTADLVE